MSISRRSIRRPVAVAMLFLAVVMLGLISFSRLAIDLLPDIAYPRLVVYTGYTGVAPMEVERFVTEPIERAVVAVPGVERVESVSREGVSLVTLRFGWGTDMDFAALNVRERLDNLRGQLPELAQRPVVMRTDPTSEPVMAISISGRGDLWSLKELAESVIKRRLEQVDGVAQAVVTGGLDREIHVDVNPGLLESYGISMADVATALEAANQSAPGGTILRGRYRYSLRTLGELRTVDEIEAVVVAERTGGGTGAETPDAASRVGLVRISDIASVDDGFRERESLTRFNGDESVGLMVFKESGANTVRVAERVEEVLAQLRVQYPEITAAVAMNQAEFVTGAIDAVVLNLLQGGVLAFLVLFLFLREPRYPIAVATAIPISVVATFALMHATGVSLNIMSLGGLALGVGMLVDNSIVVLENIFRHREAGVPAEEASAIGGEEVQSAITASTLTTIAVFGPIVYVQGVAGQLLGALSLTVAFSLLASLLVALTLLPVLAARWGRGKTLAPRFSWTRGGAVRPAQVSAPSAQSAAASAPKTGVRRWAAAPFNAFDRAFGRFAHWYEGVLLRALENRGRVLGVAGVLLVMGVLLALTLDRSVLPEVEQGAFRARVELPRGTPLEMTSQEAARLESAMRADPEVRAVFTRVGRQSAIAGMLEEDSGLNIAMLDVRLIEGARTSEVLARMQPVFAGFAPGVLSVETGRATALGRLLGGSDADLAVRIRGEDADAAFGYARQVETRLASVGALRNVRLGVPTGHPEIQVEIDRERAAAFGIEPRRIAQTVEAYMRGRVATEFLDFDRKIPVMVRLPEAERRSLETLSLLRVDGVPLRELVHTKEAVGPGEILRVEQGRVVPVFADLRTRDLEGALRETRAALAELPVPHGLRVDIGGENEEMRRSFRALAFAFALALLLVFMILAAEFESLVHPFTVLLSVPLAAIGAVVALWLTGSGLNTMSLIGLIILIGIVDNDAVVKVDFINRMRKQGMSVREAVVAAGRARLRPILMTTATTMFGVAPMAFGFGTGTGLQSPLAITVLGGLFSATALTLIVIPVAYEMVEEARERLRSAVGMRPVGATREIAATTGD
jgi:hydrophobic/amphiphilic exporter-1 (mainly G- bacteria), HAE1 family